MLKQIINKNISLDSIETLLNKSKENLELVKVNGWIKTYRNQTKYFFLGINDGSCFKNLQVIFDTEHSLSKDTQNIISILEKLCWGKY